MSRRRPPVLVREAVAAVGGKGHAVDVDFAWDAHQNLLGHEWRSPPIVRVLPRAPRPSR